MSGLKEGDRYWAYCRTCGRQTTWIVGPGGKGASCGEH